MAALLLAGSIPCAMTGLLKNAQDLIVLRFVFLTLTHYVGFSPLAYPSLFIGILGATFVPCQFWMTQMFSPSAVGTANAIAGGWGNMGAGITYLVMPAIYGGIRHHLPVSKAWRVVFVIPAGLCILVAIATLLFSTDTPHGDWLRPSELTENEVIDGLPSINKGKRKADEKSPSDIPVDNKDAGGEVTDDETIADVRRNESPLSALNNFFKVLINPAVLIMVCTYACSFGIELAIDNIIGTVYEKQFHLNPSTGAYIGSIFGLLNICSRLSGGLFSDFMGRRFHVPGRILALLIGMVLEGVFLIGFSAGLLISLSTSIVLMVFFSFFVEAVCGLTFGIVPFIDPVNNGKVMGIVGAAGTLGGLIFNLMFLGFGTHYAKAFLCLGCVALGVALIGSALLRVQNKTVWHLYKERYM